MRRKDDLSKERILQLLQHELPQLREEFGVLSLALYGSFVRGQPDEDSDIDLIVGLSRPLGFGFVALAEELEQLLGRKVDLSTFTALERSLEHPRHRSIALHIRESLAHVQAAA